MSRSFFGNQASSSLGYKTSNDGSWWEGEGWQYTPPKEELPSAASGEMINTTGEDPERG
jgi:hypothetical protein